MLLALTALWEWGAWLCCCLYECWSALDFFSREEEGVTGWTVIAGIWSCDGNNLVEAGTEDALIIFDEVSDSVENWIRWDPVNPQDGDKFRVIGFYVDPDNYYFIEYEYIDPPGPVPLYTQIRIYKRVAGVNTLLNPPLPGKAGVNVGRYDVCFGKRWIFTDRIAGAAGGQGMYWLCNQGFHENGKQMGFGNGGTSEIKFGGVNYNEHWAPDKQDCPSCACTCHENGDLFCVPMSVLATVEVVSGCATIDGHSQGLGVDYGMAPRNKVWHATAPFLSCTPPFPRKIFECWPELYCPPSGDSFTNIADWELHTEHLDGATCSGGEEHMGPKTPTGESTCDPLYLKFGPYFAGAEECLVCGENCLEEGEFYIIITEPP